MSGREVTGHPAVAVHGLTKSYGDRTGVHDLELEVPPGAVLGFLGPNGAGKTTVIRLLSTILAPDAGSFAVDGIPHTRTEDIRRVVGVLPESAGYPRQQTGEEWLVYHARLFGLPLDEARRLTRRLLAAVGLTDRAPSLVSGYSRGMRQRLGVARALVNDPRVVLLDEPTLGLDPAGQRKLLDLVVGLAAERRAAVVLSTHLLAEVEETCDHVVVLHRGRLVANGTVAEVVRKAAAPRRAHVRVAPDRQADALAALSAGPVSAAAVRDRPDEIELTMPALMGPEAASAEALRRLLDADVPVREFSLEGGRLSDAFLTLTGGG